MNSLLLIINTLLIMTHTLPPLPYAMDALAPKMSKETLEYHYGKHLQTYIDNLNNLIKGTPYENMTLEEISVKADGRFTTTVRRPGTTHSSSTASPRRRNRRPKERWPEAIKRDFGSFDAFKEQFGKAAIGLFGSGWTWLAADKDGKLVIVSESNAGNPLKKGLIPLLGIDVWEHSYYIDYRNRRADYVKNFWDIVDWKVIEKRFKK